MHIKKEVFEPGVAVYQMKNRKEQHHVYHCGRFRQIEAFDFQFHTFGESLVVIDQYIFDQSLFLRKASVEGFFRNAQFVTDILDGYTAQAEFKKQPGRGFKYIFAK